MGYLLKHKGYIMYNRYRRMVVAVSKKKKKKDKKRKKEKSKQKEGMRRKKSGNMQFQIVLARAEILWESIGYVCLVYFDVGFLLM